MTLVTVTVDTALVRKAFDDYEQWSTSIAELLDCLVLQLPVEGFQGNKTLMIKIATYLEQSREALVVESNGAYVICGLTIILDGSHTLARMGMPTFVRGQDLLQLTQEQAGRLFFASKGTIWADQAEHYGWVLNEQGGLACWADIEGYQAANLLRRIVWGELQL